MRRHLFMAAAFVALSCNPHATLPASSPEPKAAEKERLAPPRHQWLERAWAKPMGFGERGTTRDRCHYGVMVRNATDGVFIAGSQRRHKSPSPNSFVVPEWEHTMFRVSAEGNIEQSFLGDTDEGHLFFLAIHSDHVVAATRHNPDKWGIYGVPDARVIVSVRSRLGVPAHRQLELERTAHVFPLPEDRWLAVGARPPHTTKIWSWSGIKSARRHHPEHPDVPAPSPVMVLSVAARGEAWAMRGLRSPDTWENMVRVFDGQEGNWKATFPRGIALGDMVFDNGGNLWLTGNVVADSVLGNARFGAPPRLPDDLPDMSNARRDRRPSPKEQRWVWKRRIHSLFGDFFRRPTLAGRQMDIDSVLDGVVLRYTPDGRLTLLNYYPSGALMWPGPLIADGRGVTAVFAVEGYVPSVLRRHPDIPSGFTGTTLLLHFDANGHIVWAQPLGKGERIVRQLVRVSDGYVVLAINEAGECELSRWRWPARVSRSDKRHQQVSPAPMPVPRNHPEDSTNEGVDTRQIDISGSRHTTML